MVFCSVVGSSILGIVGKFTAQQFRSWRLRSASRLASRPMHSKSRSLALRAISVSVVSFSAAWLGIAVKRCCGVLSVQFIGQKLRWRYATLYNLWLGVASHNKRNQAEIYSGDCFVPKKPGTKQSPP